MRWSLRRQNTRRAIGAGLGVLFLALLAYQAWGENGYFALRRKWMEERDWQARNEALRRHNEDLAKQVQRLRTDPKAIEKIAREELMLVRPEDKIIFAPQKK